MLYLHVEPALLPAPDLKPRNLLVNSNCDLKICDYGRLGRSLVDGCGSSDLPSLWGRLGHQIQVTQKSGSSHIKWSQLFEAHSCTWDLTAHVPRAVWDPPRLARLATQNGDSRPLTELEPQRRGSPSQAAALNALNDVKLQTSNLGTPTPSY